MKTHGSKHAAEQPKEDGAGAGCKFVTANEFAAIARLSRRQIDRLRRRRPPGFPTEYELGGAVSKYRRCPRFKLAEVLAWIETRALW
jgi:predicted DNA-binding transcriptional regulator AlpA